MLFPLGLMEGLRFAAAWSTLPCAFKGLLWRPWWRRHQLLDIKLCHIKPKALTEKAQWCWKDCHLLQSVGWEQWQNDSQTVAWILVSRAEMPDSPLLSLMWLQESLGPSLPYFSFLLCRQCGIVQGIMTKRKTSFHSEVALGWWVSHFISLGFI